MNNSRKLYTSSFKYQWVSRSKSKLFKIVRYFDLDDNRGDRRWSRSFNSRNVRPATLSLLFFFFFFIFSACHPPHFISTAHVRLSPFHSTFIHGQTARLTDCIGGALNALCHFYSTPIPSTGVELLRTISPAAE